MVSWFDNVRIYKPIPILFLPQYKLFRFLSPIGKSGFKDFALVLKRDLKLHITLIHVLYRNRLSDLVARALATKSQRVSLYDTLMIVDV